MNTFSNDPFVKKYKIFFVPSIFLLLSFVLIFRIIIPQFTSISDTQMNIDQQKKEVEELKETIQAINSINGPEISSQVETVNNALPAGKDLIAIYQSLSSLAQKSQVIIRGFTLEVGGIYDKAQPQVSEDAQSSLALKLHVSSSQYEKINQFADSLYASLPISGVKTLRISKTEGELELMFYYKPYNIELLAKQKSIKPLTPQEQQLLDQLSSWKQTQ